jgi:Ni,Fe-hydrogenase I small subunit
MAKTLYWIQGGSCGGDTWSLFNADTPDLTELFDFLGLELLWHQSLSSLSSDALDALNRDILEGRQPLDILCLEGSVIHGPQGQRQV